MELFRSWTLSIVFIFKLYNNLSETEFCLRLRVEPTKLGPIDRACPYQVSGIWTRSVDWDRHRWFQPKMEPECTFEALSGLIEKQRGGWRPEAQ
jgi:hypothetical protein